MAPRRDSEKEPGSARPATFLVLFPSIVLPLFLGVVDQTIVATALPAIASSLGKVDFVLWVVVAYLIASIIAAPVYGRLGDVFGRRRLLVVALCVSVTGSALCAAAWSMEVLIGSRFLQGLGGGGLLGLSHALMGQALEPRARARYQGFISAVAVSASAFGPVAGGFLTEHFGWRSIFLVTIPLGFAAMAMAFRLPPRMMPRQTFRFDWIGLLALSTTVTILLVQLQFGLRAFIENPAASLMLGAFMLVSMALFVHREIRGADPLIPLPLLRNASILRANGLAFCLGACAVSLVTFMPLYLRVVHGLSAGEIGVLILPMTCGIGLGALVTGQLVGRTGRTTIFPGVGMFLVALMLVRLGIGVDTLTPVGAAAWMGACAVGLGTVMAVVQVTVIAEAEPSILGSAVSTIQLARTLGASIGAATVGTVLFSTIFAEGRAAYYYLQSMIRGHEMGPLLSGAAEVSLKASILSGFGNLFFAIAAYAALGCAMAWWIPRRSL